MSRGNFWRILLCILCVMGPLWLLKGVSVSVYPPPQNPLLSLLIESVHSFLQLFTSVVLFRMFMLIEAKPDNR